MKRVRNGFPSHIGMVLTRAMKVSVTLVSKLVTWHIYREPEMAHFYYCGYETLNNGKNPLKLFFKPIHFNAVDVSVEDMI